VLAVEEGVWHKASGGRFWGKWAVEIQPKPDSGFLRVYGHVEIHYCR
jgi:hypothetical protein